MASLHTLTQHRNSIGIAVWVTQPALFSGDALRCNIEVSPPLIGGDSVILDFISAEVFGVAISGKGNKTERRQKSTLNDGNTRSSESFPLMSPHNQIETCASYERHQSPHQQCYPSLSPQFFPFSSPYSQISHHLHQQYYFYPHCQGILLDQIVSPNSSGDERPALSSCNPSPGTSSSSSTWLLKKKLLQSLGYDSEGAEQEGIFASHKLLFTSQPTIVATDVSFSDDQDVRWYGFECILPPFLPPSFSGSSVRYSYFLVVSAHKRSVSASNNFLRKSKPLVMPPSGHANQSSSEICERSRIGSRNACDTSVTVPAIDKDPPGSTALPSNPKEASKFPSSPHSASFFSFFRPSSSAGQDRQSMRIIQSLQAPPMSTSSSSFLPSKKCSNQFKDAVQSKALFTEMARNTVADTAISETARVPTTTPLTSSLSLTSSRPAPSTSLQVPSRPQEIRVRIPIHLLGSRFYAAPTLKTLISPILPPCKKRREKCALISTKPQPSASSSMLQRESPVPSSSFSINEFVSPVLSSKTTFSGSVRVTPPDDIYQHSGSNDQVTVRGLEGKRTEDRDGGGLGGGSASASSFSFLGLFGWKDEKRGGSRGKANYKEKSYYCAETSFGASWSTNTSAPSGSKNPLLTSLSASDSNRDNDVDAVLQDQLSRLNLQKQSEWYDPQLCFDFRCHSWQGGSPQVQLTRLRGLQSIRSAFPSAVTFCPRGISPNLLSSPPFACPDKGSTVARLPPLAFLAGRASQRGRCVNVSSGNSGYAEGIGGGCSNVEVKYSLSQAFGSLALISRLEQERWKIFRESCSLSYPIRSSDIGGADRERSNSQKVSGTRVDEGESMKSCADVEWLNSIEFLQRRVVKPLESSMCLLPCPDIAYPLFFSAFGSPITRQQRRLYCDRSMSTAIRKARGIFIAAPWGLDALTFPWPSGPPLPENAPDHGDYSVYSQADSQRKGNDEDSSWPPLSFDAPYDQHEEMRGSGSPCGGGETNRFTDTHNRLGYMLPPPPIPPVLTHRFRLSQGQGHRVCMVELQGRRAAEAFCVGVGCTLSLHLDFTDASTETHEIHVYILREERSFVNNEFKHSPPSATKMESSSTTSSQYSNKKPPPASHSSASFTHQQQCHLPHPQSPSEYGHISSLAKTPLRSPESIPSAIQLVWEHREVVLHKATVSIEAYVPPYTCPSFQSDIIDVSYSLVLKLFNAVHPCVSISGGKGKSRNPSSTGTGRSGMYNTKRQGRDSHSTASLSALNSVKRGSKGGKIKGSSGKSGLGVMAKIKTLKMSYPPSPLMSPLSHPPRHPPPLASMQSCIPPSPITDSTDMLSRATSVLPKPEPLFTRETMHGQASSRACELTPTSAKTDNKKITLQKVKDLLSCAAKQRRRNIREEMELSKLKDSILFPTGPSILPRLNPFDHPIKRHALKELCWRLPLFVCPPPGTTLQSDGSSGGTGEKGGALSFGSLSSSVGFGNVSGGLPPVSAYAGGLTWGCSYPEAVCGGAAEDADDINDQVIFQGGRGQGQLGEIMGRNGMWRCDDRGICSSCLDEGDTTTFAPCLNYSLSAIAPLLSDGLSRMVRVGYV